MKRLKALIVLLLLLIAYPLLFALISLFPKILYVWPYRGNSQLVGENALFHATAPYAAPLLMAFLIGAWALYRRQKLTRNQYKAAFYLSFLLIPIGVSASIKAINYYYDNATPNIRQYYVTLRYEESDHKTYYVSVDNGIPGSEMIEIQVAKTQYDNLHTGDPLLVAIHPGYLHIPWVSNRELRRP